MPATLAIPTSRDSSHRTARGRPTPETQRCRVLGCDRNTAQGGYCCEHGARFLPGECSVPDCDRRIRAEGKCRRHYERGWRFRLPGTRG